MNVYSYGYCSDHSTYIHLALHKQKSYSKHLKSPKYTRDKENGKTITKIGLTLYSKIIGYKIIIGL